MKKTDYIDELLARYFAKEPLSFTQKKDLDIWIKQNQALFEQLKQISNELTLSSDIDFNTPKAWRKIKPSLQTSPRKSRHILLKISAAASIIFTLIFSLRNFLNNEVQELDYTNVSQTQIELVLPDQSSVTVYPGATIHYMARHKRGDRFLSLTGQAFFQIQKKENRPFIIQAYHTQIKVLGTSFCVDAISQNQTYVKVKTGKVSVTNSEQSVILKANEQATVTANKIIKSQLSKATKLPVRKAFSHRFEKTSIIDVIKLLEQHFNIAINLDSCLLNNTITTTINTDNLEDILLELSYLSKSKLKKNSDSEYNLYVE